eukprot:1580859-Prymnesium_polylepis.1
MAPDKWLDSEKGNMLATLISGLKADTKYGLSGLDKVELVRNLLDGRKQELATAEVQASQMEAAAGEMGVSYNHHVDIRQYEKREMQERLNSQLETNCH